MTKAEIRVPHLGDFIELPIVELHVTKGASLKLEQAVVTVESDKATMDIPSPLEGTVDEICVKVGDLIREGTLLARVTLESNAERETVPKPYQINGNLSDTKASLVVIGGGPGGYSAAFRAADLGMDVVLVERHETLGGVCLNVGCIPSKALLHLTAVKEEAEALAAHGIAMSTAKIDIEKIRDFKASVVRKLTSGLSSMAKARKVKVVRGDAQFTSQNSIMVTRAEGAHLLTFENCIIAAGSTAIKLAALPDDPRIVTSTGALDLKFIPKRMLVIGGGIIGLEMATVYSALGSQVDVVERQENLLTGVDRDIVSIWLKQNRHRFQRIMTNTTLERAEANERSIDVHFSGPETSPASYDLILQAPGRVPNGSKLSLDQAGVKVERGFVVVNSKMQTNVEHIYAVGDIVGQPMLAHKAVHQGHIAAEVAAGHKAGFDTDIIPSVCYTSPEIAWAGLTEAQAANRKMRVKTARFPWAASGRAIANGAEYGLTKLLFSEETGRIVGGAMIGPNAGDMIGEIVLAMELGADAFDIGRTIHPHPTLSETVGLAAEVSLGTCTDIPPSQKR